MKNKRLSNNLKEKGKQVMLEKILSIIDRCLGQLYEKDSELFEGNEGRGISERGIVFRFAYYLQLEINKNYPGYFVDCDFNSSALMDKNRNPNEESGKSIPDLEDTKKKHFNKYTKRFIDIIIHKRNTKREDNLFCFEVKKWNCYGKKCKDAKKKDTNNLKYLTLPKYDYKYGFHLILGRHKQDAKCNIFKNGMQITKGEVLCTAYQTAGKR